MTLIRVFYSLMRRFQELHKIVRVSANWPNYNNCMCCEMTI